VLARASLETQRLVASSGLPAVVFGTPFPSVDALSSLDCDHPTAAAEEHGERLGRLLLERATRPGAAPRHERLAVELVEPTRRDS
jgi:hypothetical protein